MGFCEKIKTWVVCVVLACLLLTVSILPAYSQQHVSTQHNDLYRTGWYSTETKLNVNNVKPGKFGKIFTRTVDDQIYAQPLVILHMNVPGIGIRNVVFVSTVNNSVYAFDADSPLLMAPYWQKSLTPAGSRPPRNSDMSGACGGNYQDFSGNIGIVSTPVIDTVTNTMYVLARNLITATNTFQQFLHAL